MKYIIESYVPYEWDTSIFTQWPLPNTSNGPIVQTLATTYTFPEINIKVEGIPQNNETFTLTDQWNVNVLFKFDNTSTVSVNESLQVIIGIKDLSTTAAIANAVSNAIKMRLDTNNPSIDRDRVNLRVSPQINAQDPSVVQITQIDHGYGQYLKDVDMSGVTGITTTSWGRYPTRINVTNPSLQDGFNVDDSMRWTPTGDPVWVFDNNCDCDEGDDFEDKYEPCCGIEWYEYTVYDPARCCSATGSIKIVMPPPPLDEFEVTDYSCTDASGYGTNKLSWEWSGYCVHRFEIWRSPSSDDGTWTQIGIKYTTSDPISGAAWFSDDCEEYYNKDLDGEKYLPGDPGTESTTSYTIYKATQGDIVTINPHSFTYVDPVDNFPDYNGDLTLNPTNCTDSQTYYYKIVPCCVAVSASKGQGLQKSVDTFGQSDHAGIGIRDHDPHF